MKSFSILTSAFLLVASAIAMAVVDVLLDERYWESLEDVIVLMGGDGSDGDAGGWWSRRGGIFLLVSASGLALMELGGYGSATFDDMQNDVMDALAWLDANYGDLDLFRKEDGGSSTSGRIGKRGLFVFGGYSSGGHVAATVTQNATLWRNRNLPDPHVHCDAILYISPVLSTRAYHDDVIRKKITSLPSLASSSSSLTSSSGATDSALEDETLSTSSSHEVFLSTTALASASSAPPPTWLTDRVVRAVFGHRAAPGIPSPIHTYDRSPPVPHIFLGCRYEMFGLTWLDAFFCSSDFSELLNGVGVESRYRAIRSDHWNILGSAELRSALKEELGRIKQECRIEKVR
jgi:hypothetical protein